MTTASRKLRSSLAVENVCIVSWFCSVSLAVTVAPQQWLRARYSVCGAPSSLLKSLDNMRRMIPWAPPLSRTSIRRLGRKVRCSRELNLFWQSWSRTHVAICSPAQSIRRPKSASGDERSQAWSRETVIHVNPC